LKNIYFYYRAAPSDEFKCIEKKCTVGNRFTSKADFKAHLVNCNSISTRKEDIHSSGEDSGIGDMASSK
jgi:hypothetical protein